jgi:membrane-bound serine protease (ClpP class)
MFFVVALVVLLLLPSPWNVIGCVVSLVLAVLEVAYWKRVVGTYRVRAGAETLLGAHATVVRPCRPRGQVRVNGEIWEATSASGADRGDEVTVVGREGLTLIVEREPSDA